MPKGILIPPTGVVQEIDIDGLAEYQNAVGGYIEPLRVAEDLFALIDEEGKMKGAEPNLRATALCVANHTRLMPGDHIVGPMIVFGPADLSGKPTDISDFNRDQLLQLKEY
jgi:hypothetical protein